MFQLNLCHFAIVMGFLGQLFGLSKKGKIVVLIDKPHYISGEIITGSLQVQVLEPIECNEVCVIVSGKEKVSWTENRTENIDGESRQVSHTVINGREFFKQKIVLFNVQHHIPVGNYVYPFQYQLPQGLPGCFDNTYDSGVHAKIEYSVKGTLCIDGMFTRDLKSRQKLTVYSQLAGNVSPSYAEKTQTVRLFCCFSQGQCHLRVAMDKNMYGPGEVPMINCDIVNQSKKDIRTMRCELIRVVEVYVHGRHRTLTKVICGANFPGVPAGTDLTQPQPFQLNGKDLYPSTRGEFIMCRYHIEVTCDIPWCPDVCLELPIALGAPILVPVAPKTTSVV
nr:secreted protein [Thraustotheca clavata]